MNLAVIWGATEIILLGYDMQDTGGKAHWFGDHPKGVNSIRPFPRFIDAFNQAAPVLEKAGIKVINCTRKTALKCFERQPIERAIRVSD